LIQFPSIFFFHCNNNIITFPISVAENNLILLCDIATSTSIKKAIFSGATINRPLRSIIEKMITAHYYKGKVLKKEEKLLPSVLNSCYNKLGEKNEKIYDD